MIGRIREAARVLVRSPGYTLICILVLALGIGANALVFSVVDSVVLRPLPYPHLERLVFVWERFPAMPLPFGARLAVRRRNYEEWKRQNTVFEEMAAFTGQTLEESGSGHPRLSVGFGSAGVFPLLGASARVGRLFSARDDHVAVLSDDFFESRFHRDPAAVGKALVIGREAYTVIGVLPPKFHLPSTYEGDDQKKFDVWVPLSRQANPPDNPEGRLFVMARLKRGVLLAQARAEMNRIEERLAGSDPQLDRMDWEASVFPFTVEDTGPKLRRALYVLTAAVAFLLLIACANLANLALAQAAQRSREIAIRLAIGAMRTRITAQLLTEALLLSLAGAAIGLLLARWGLRLMLALKPADIQRPELIAIDYTVFAFAATASCLTTVLFGLAPALAASRQDLNTALKTGGAGARSVAGSGSRQFLIGVEAALALTLLSGAGLMIRSFQQLLAVGVGFRTAQLTLADVSLPAARYPDGASQSRFYRRLVEQARGIPGISAAAVVDNAPLHTVGINNFYILGRPEPDPKSLPISDVAHASAEFFGVIGLRLERGRLFTTADAMAGEGERALVVNRAFVRQFFPHEEPLGQHLMTGNRKYKGQIVGIVSDYRPMGVENGPRATVFWPDLDMPGASLVVRSELRPEALARALREMVWSIDKSLPAVEARPMQYYVDEWLSQRKFNTLLLAIFAGLALALGTIGIYGVVSNLVASRTREIGIRMAVGASPAQIARLVMRQGMIPVLLGVAAGIGGSFALGRSLEGLLFQVPSRDPLTMAVAVSAIVAMSAAAIHVPLRRAMRIDCTAALRQD